MNKKLVIIGLFLVGLLVISGCAQMSPKEIAQKKINIIQSNFSTINIDQSLLHCYNNNNFPECSGYNCPDPEWNPVGEGGFYECTDQCCSMVATIIR
jgi:hypothetical protein